MSVAFILCPASSCDGHFESEQGACNTCGRTLLDALENAPAPVRPRKRQNDTPAPLPGMPPARKRSGSEPRGRLLCPDGNCVGVIDAQGRCGTCGRTLAELVQEAEPRTMSAGLGTSLPEHGCACGSRRYYRVHPVRERQGRVGGIGVMPALPASISGAGGSFELAVCERCGHLEWRVQVRAAVLEQRPRAEGRCLGCEAPVRFVLDATDGRREGLSVRHVPLVALLGKQRLLEASPASQPGEAPVAVLRERWVTAGRCPLEASACARCRLVQWRALHPEQIDPSNPDVRAHDEACPRCTARGRWRMPSREWTTADHVADRAVAYRPGLLLAEPLGRLEVVVCSACGHVDWIARDLDELAEAVKATGETGGGELRLVEIASVAHAGPYRSAH